MTGAAPPVAWSLRWSALTGAVIAIAIFALHDGTGGSLDGLVVQALAGALLFAAAAVVHNGRRTAR